MKFSKKHLAALVCLLAAVAICLAVFLGRSGRAEVLHISSQEGMSATLENLSYTQDGHFTATISLTLDQAQNTAAGADAQTQLEELKDSFDPTIAYGETSQPLVVKSSSLRTEGGAPATLVLEIDTWLTLNPPPAEEPVQISLTGFSEPFQTTLA